MSQFECLACEYRGKRVNYDDNGEMICPECELFTIELIGQQQCMNFQPNLNTTIEFKFKKNNDYRLYSTKSFQLNRIGTNILGNLGDIKDTHEQLSIALVSHLLLYLFCLIFGFSVEIIYRMKMMIVWQDIKYVIN